MPLFDILTLIGFGFGTALAVVLLILSLQYRPKRAVDAGFAVLFLSIILWFGGNFIAVCSTLLFGTVAAGAAKLFNATAYLGLAFAPSALLHIQVVARYSGRIRRLAVAALYAPALAFTVHYAEPFLRRIEAVPGRTALVSVPFLLWLLFCIGASVAFSFKLSQRQQRESDRNFYRDISRVLALAGVGVLLIHLLSFRRLPYVGQYLDLIVLLSPALPLAVLLYYVYRYNFYRLIIKPSFVHSILYGLLMAAYLLGIRRIGNYLQQFPEVNADLIEALLLVALVFAFQPFRAAFQARLDKLFFRDRYYYQLFLRELSDSISSIVDLDELTRTLRRSLKAALKVKECAIVIFSNEKEEPEILKGSDEAEVADLSLLVQALRSTRHFSLRRQMRDPRVQAALEGSRLALTVPIFFREELRGLICLGGKESGNVFSDEELDVLQTFANQIGLAFENARLVQERLELIARIHQAEKLNSLGQLAATMSHEIKNPLSSIKAIVQVMYENSGSSDRADLALVLEEVDRLQQILQKLLSFARPSAAAAEEVDMAQTVRDVLSLLAHQARQAGVELNAELAEVPHLMAKLQAVREIVFNLVLNAVQACPSGGRVDVGLSLNRLPARRRGRNAKPTITLTVSDSGEGVPEALRSRIFEPFYTSKTIGAGLGLAIVKRNVEELGGSITVSESPQGGALFTVHLPVKEPTPSVHRGEP